MKHRSDPFEDAHYVARYEDWYGTPYGRVADRVERELLPFRDGALDGVFLVAVLEFDSNPVALLREARRVAHARVVVRTVSRRSWLGLRRRVAGKLGHRVFARALRDAGHAARARSRVRCARRAAAQRAGPAAGAGRAAAEA